MEQFNDFKPMFRYLVTNKCFDGRRNAFTVSVNTTTSPEQQHFLVGLGREGGS